MDKKTGLITKKNNVYIGNRYVPVFANPVEWNNLREYEPLTIVTHQGTSYTSKKTVPVGTELSDTEYWVVTGNYNQQVEAYRQEVENLSHRVDDLSEDVSEDISELRGNLVSLTTKVNSIPKNLRDKNLFVVGDSWAVGFTDSTGQGFVEELSDRNIFKSVHKYAAGGIGYTTDISLLSKLQELESDYANNLDDVNIIIIQGGVNDYPKSTSAIQSGASTTFAYARSHFPNAEIYAIANITSTRNADWYEKSELPLKVAASNGCIPLYWPHRMLYGHETQFTDDKYHLKHIACVYYANNIINNILGHFAFDPDGNTITTPLGSSTMADFYSAAQQINFEGRYVDLLIVATSGKRNSDPNVPLFTFTNDYLPSIGIHGVYSITKPKFYVDKPVVSGSNIKHNNLEFELDNNGNVKNIYDAADLASNISMGDIRFRFDRLARAFM